MCQALARVPHSRAALPARGPASLFPQTRSHGSWYLGDVHHGVHLFLQLSVFQPHLAEPVGRNRWLVFLQAWSPDVALAWEGRRDPPPHGTKRKSCQRAGGGDLHPQVHLPGRTQVSRPTDTQTRKISHRHRVTVRSRGQLLSHTWVCVLTRLAGRCEHRHTRTHAHTHNSGPHVLMAASSLRWCLRAPPESFLRACL